MARILPLILPWSSLVVGLAGVACSRLPDYAAPQRHDLTGVDPSSGDLIPYRELTRADFRGTEAPPAFAAVADRVGAATCARIVTTPDTQLEITSVTTPEGETTYTATIKQIGFVALMDRSCSWWNEEASAQNPEYVLEHEQIHFALFEIEARRLNAEAQDFARSVQNTGTSKEQVQEQAQKEIEETLEEASEEILERNRDFDEDTSLGYEPERQKEWLRTVTQELAETAG